MTRIWRIAQISGNADDAFGGLRRFWGTRMTRIWRIAQIVWKKVFNCNGHKVDEGS